MNPKVVDEAGFVVIGIEARTNNVREMNAGGVIPRQWERFVQESLLDTIPNRTDSLILAVYSDYASDKDGEYSFLIGARVSSTAGLPAGMIAKTVPAGRYAIFTSKLGPVEKVIPEIWQQIWLVPKSAVGGDRAYRADYEVYDNRASDPKNAQVEVHVGIK
jgi:predicted transcriptional regulator YdeE